jgi:hypothetical protein
MNNIEPKQTKCYCGHTINCDCESPQETLEEAAFESSVDYKPFEDDLKPQKYYEYGFIKGAKWQQERMYSEEDMIEFAKYCNLKDDLSVRELLVIWFEQFKKK